MRESLTEADKLRIRQLNFLRLPNSILKGSLYVALLSIAYIALISKTGTRRISPVSNLNDLIDRMILAISLASLIFLPYFLDKIIKFVELRAGYLDKVELIVESKIRIGFFKILIFKPFLIIFYRHSNHLKNLGEGDEIKANRSFLFRLLSYEVVKKHKPYYESGRIAPNLYQYPQGTVFSWRAMIASGSLFLVGAIFLYINIFGLAIPCLLPALIIYGTTFGLEIDLGRRRCNEYYRFIGIKFNRYRYFDQIEGLLIKRSFETIWVNFHREKVLVYDAYLLFTNGRKLLIMNNEDKEDTIHRIIPIANDLQVQILDKSSD